MLTPAEELGLSGLSLASRVRKALSFASISVGSVMFFCCAMPFSSSFALLWSSTIRCPNCFT